MKKGEVATQEFCKKLSLSHKGQVPWNKGLDKTDPRVAAYASKVGHGWTESSRKKLSLSKTGKRLSDGHREALSQVHKGKMPSNFGINFGGFGDKNVNWKGGITSGVVDIRGSLEYRNWRMMVLKRDNFTCQGCGVRGVKFHVDHIKRFSDYPELRFDISNGRTLCVPCHKATPTYGNRPQ